MARSVASRTVGRNGELLTSGMSSCDDSEALPTDVDGDGMGTSTLVVRRVAIVGECRVMRMFLGRTKHMGMQ